jgi:hypothetical protein
MVADRSACHKASLLVLGPLPQMSSDQELLKQLLLRPNHPPVGILDEPLRRKVAPSVAILMLKSGTYEWCGSTRRVRKMWQVNKAPAWVACYRTTHAPALQPSIEWLRTRNTVGQCRVYPNTNARLPVVSMRALPSR